MRRVMILALVMLLAIPVVAQQAPTWTATDQLRLQNYDLQLRLAQTQLQLIQATMQQAAQEREAFIRAAETRHPGWTVNRSTLAWERIPEQPKR